MTIQDLETFKVGNMWYARSMKHACEQSGRTKKAAVAELVRIIKTYG